MSKIEDRFNLCLEYFSENEDITEKNTNNNIEILKKYCIQYFIKLKNDIEMKNILLDDDIFLSVYKKLKEIEKYKNECLKVNMEKYKKLNALLQPFIGQLYILSNNMKNNFEQILNKDIYEVFMNNIKENIVNSIEKEEINHLMFNNLSVQRKSLLKISTGEASIENNIGKNSINSCEQNPFQRNENSISKNINGIDMDSIIEISDINNNINANNNLNDEKQNNLEQFSLKVTNVQNNEGNEDLKIKDQIQVLIKEENDVFFQDNNNIAIAPNNNSQTNIINKNSQNDVSDISVENNYPDTNILPVK